MKPSPAPAVAEFYLALQPIFDRELRLYAYELLFRAGDGEDARVLDDHRASATVMHHVFNKLGADAVLGPHLGFINLDAAMLASSVVERLPKDKVVLEILETVEVSVDLVARCAALARQGFRLALDDFSGQEERFEPLLPVVNVIKVDLHRVAPGSLEQTTERLRRWPARLLAEKIDSEQQAQRCRDLGYDLFQGYHLGRPRLISFGPRTLAADTPGRELLDVRRIPR